MSELEIENTFLKLQLKVHQKNSRAHQTELENKIKELETKLQTFCTTNEEKVNNEIKEVSGTKTVVTEAISFIDSNELSILLENERNKNKELERYLTNLKWGFQQREESLQRRISIQKKTIIDLYSAQKSVIQSLRDVCDITCGELDELDQLVD